jgi:hypothetical protein
VNDKNEATWQYEVDSVQRQGTTGATKARRHGEVSCPEPTDGNEPNNHHGDKENEQPAHDKDGIPTGI